MKVTFYSNVTSRDSAVGFAPGLSDFDMSFYRLDDRQPLLANANGTQVLLADAMGVVDREIIDSMPSLRLIMSEGVGYQGFDVAYASQKGIAVCNNKGVNDSAVAEDALLLMLGCLKSIITGNQSVYDGRQIEVKKASFGIIKELSQCTVGLIGFGDIAKKTAQMCGALGARVIYTNRTRYAGLEEEYGVEYFSLDALLAQSDFVSLHTAVTPQTTGMVDAAFLSKMKKDAYLINTSRGDLVDNGALLDALLENKIAGAGLDVISPEPVEKDNILLDARIKDKLVLTPHIAGITNLTVSKIYKNINENINRLINNEPLRNRVN